MWNDGGIWLGTKTWVDHSELGNSLETVTDKSSLTSATSTKIISTAKAAFTLVTVTADYDVEGENLRVLCDSTSALAIALKAGSRVYGNELNIIRVNTGAVTITDDTALLISGDSSLVLTGRWDSVSMTYDGLKWVRCG